MILWYIGCAVLWFCAFVFTCMVLCNFQKIRLVVCIIKATARFINENIIILFVPIINTLIAAVWIGLWIFGSIYIYANGTMSKNENYYPWSTVTHEDVPKYSFWFTCFFGLWVLAFMVSLNVFVIASACVIWYFQQDSGKDQEKGKKSRRNPCCTGYCWAWGIHMGSIAFGSFILAAVWALQIAMLILESQMKKGAAKNKIVEYIFKCIHCCLACFERLIKFLNKQAYIQIAITGKSFCPSAWKGFMCVMNHVMDFGLLAIIGNGFMYIAIVLIAMGSAALAWLFLNNTSTYENISSKWMPVGVVFIIGWVVGKLFANVYMVACYAILQSFYHDVELSKGKNKPPRYTPAELRDFVERAQKL